MLGHSDRAGCWICDRLVGFEFDLDSLNLTEQEVMDQLGRRDRGPHMPSARASWSEGTLRDGDAVKVKG